MIGSDHLGFQRIALRLAAGLALSAVGLTGGCVARNPTAGPKLSALALPAELRDLVRQAQAGDKLAQFELGTVFEEGRGVARDLALARELYRAAARDDPGYVWVYVPSPGGGVPAQVQPVQRSPQAGLAAAKRRLDIIK